MLPSPRLVAAARILAEVTQAELADRSGVSLSAIKRLEIGITDARSSTIRALVKALRECGIAFTYDPATNREGIYHRLPVATDGPQDVPTVDSRHKRVGAARSRKSPEKAEH